ncbi:MAG: hypothetical protein VB140_07910 [Burkholderia sp.]
MLHTSSLRTLASTGIISGDTNGWRTSEVRHPFVSPEIMPVDASVLKLDVCNNA